MRYVIRLKYSNVNNLLMWKNVAEKFICRGQAKFGWLHGSNFSQIYLNIDGYFLVLKKFAEH